MGPGEEEGRGGAKCYGEGGLPSLSSIMITFTTDSPTIMSGVMGASMMEKLSSSSLWSSPMMVNWKQTSWLTVAPGGIVKFMLSGKKSTPPERREDNYYWKI